MKKNYITILTALLIGVTAKSQTIYSDFEDLGLPIDSFWNGNDLPGNFTSNSVTYLNFYDTAWGGSWSGVSYSTMRDTITAGFGNQYSCIAGKGEGNSNTYAVVYPNSSYLVKIPVNRFCYGIWVNNSTYAYKSMKNGDSFAKKFGDSTNASGTIDGTNGNDWFKLTIFDSNPNDSIEFYLADFRGPDSTDYIIKDWTFVPFSNSMARNSDSLKFKLTSSDNASWGMNTPNYFCMDSLTFTGNLFSINENLKRGVSTFPNPTTGKTTVKFEDVSSGNYTIYSVTGSVIDKQEFNSVQSINLDLTKEDKGMYIVSLNQNGNIITKRIIKQ
ncbi:DUF4465 domain-containing protein [Flavobacteriales bacterium]|nr:DUF4465 domain-containing protein [Flavobacteriales bacterium]